MTTLSFIFHLAGGRLRRMPRALDFKRRWIALAAHCRRSRDSLFPRPLLLARPLLVATCTSHRSMESVARRG